MLLRKRQRKIFFIFAGFLASAFLLFTNTNLVLAQALTTTDFTNAFNKIQSGVLTAAEWNRLLGSNGTDAPHIIGEPTGFFVNTLLPAAMKGQLGININPGEGAGGTSLRVKSHGTGNVLGLFNNTGTEIFTVSNNGRVGIGAITPGYTLDVLGDVRTGANLYVRDGTTGAHNLWLYRGDLGGHSWRLQNQSGIFSIFGGDVNASMERLRIDTLGNIGIGTTTINAKLSVSNSATNYSILAGMQRIGNLAEPFENTDAATKGYVDTGLGSLAPGGASSTWGILGTNIYNTNLGNVGIGTSTPTEKLDVNGTARIRTMANAIGDMLTVSTSGVIQKRTATETRVDIGAAKEINSLYYVEGNTSGTAGTWTGSIDGVSAYYDGLSIAYKIGIAGATPTTLNINGLGAVVARRNTGNLTTHLPVGTVAVFTYTTISGTPYWVWADYDSTQSYDMRWINIAIAGDQVTRYKYIMEGVDGKFYPLTLENSTAGTKTVSTAPFKLGGHILEYSYTGTIAADAQLSANSLYSQRYVNNQCHYTFNQSSGFIAGMPVYLKGTIQSDGSFKLDNTTATSWLTQTLPTSEDGFVYIHIGFMHNTTTAFTLTIEHSIYEFRDGKIRLYETFAGSGNSNYLAKWTGSNSFGNSQIFDNGTNVGIGTTSPTAKLSIDNADTYSILAGLQRIGNVADPFEDSDAVNKGYLDTAVESILPGGASSTWGIFGTAIYNLNTAGQVGVGTGASALGSKFVVKGGGTTSASSALNVTNSSNSSLFFVRDDGNVGIGTSTPSSKLHVAGDSYLNGALNVSGNTSFSGNTHNFYQSSSPYSTLSVGRGSTQRFAMTVNDMVGTMTSYQQDEVLGDHAWIFNIVSPTTGLQNYYFRNNGTNLLTITKNGSVGIGTTTPGARLSVATPDTYSILAGMQRIGNVAEPFENTDAATKGYVDAIVGGSGGIGSGEINQTLRHDGSGWVASSLIFNNGTNVGINNTNPTAGTLAVTGNISATTGFRIGTSDVITSGRLFRGADGSVGAPAFSFSADTNTGIYRGGTDILSFSTAGVNRLTILANGRIGSGGITPGVNFDIDGSLRATTINVGGLVGQAGIATIDVEGNLGVTSAGVLPSGLNGQILRYETAGGWQATSSVFISDAGNVGIGTTTPGVDSLRVLGSVSIFGSLNMGLSNITGVEKLTVNTIDPLYRIKGINYSTFASSIVGGVKEEYVGRIDISQKSKSGGYERVIDFSKELEGSDLWVWRKTVDFSEENVEVMITPYGSFAQTYFEIDGEKLTLRSDKSVKVAFRLVGRRFDWKKWPTKAIDQNESPGFVIN